MSPKISFSELELNPQIEKALVKQGYTEPTPIQSKSIPGLLKGRDLIGIAQTGTGKTASFALPILQLMKESYPRKIKALIVTPTRELASQIGESFQQYGEFLNFKHTVIFGGVGQGKQVQALKSGVDILIATPGRLLDLLNQKKLTLKYLEFFVLDEADRMLDMGFVNDIKKIITQIPSKRQSLFFSATMSPTINELAKSLLKNPIHVEVTPQATTVEKIKQTMFFVDSTEKNNLLLELFKNDSLKSILIFTRTKFKANKVSQFLNENNISADAIHGNKSQNARTKAIKDFKSGNIKVLVATDIAARGIDIDNITHVINYELPNEPETYVHRIGRTARAGASGSAYSFCAADERNFLRDIEKLIKLEINVEKHKFHSESAKNATGAAAKPPPKKGRGSSQRSNPRNRNDKGKNTQRTKNTFSKKPSKNANKYGSQNKDIKIEKKNTTFEKNKIKKIKGTSESKPKSKGNFSKSNKFKRRF